MVTVIGTTFPVEWQYGPEENEIIESTRQQIQQRFPNQTNLLINTTWFGPQFNNGQWAQAQELIAQGQLFDNLFLLSCIDPCYITDDQIADLQRKFQSTLYKIGMFADIDLEWNFHAVVGAKHCPDYSVDDLQLKTAEHAFLLYQRKPRRHRVELTNLLIDQGLDQHGIVTLGSNKNSGYDWSEGMAGPVLTIKDYPTDYKHNGQHDDFDGVPNDLVTLGRLDIWQHHFLNIISETEYNSWHPRFITEKTWKPIIGMRPFVIHGQTSIYAWLRQHGFRTFNHYWSDIPIESSEDVHATVIDVIKFCSEKTPEQLKDLYQTMLPDLEYNRNRFYEFAREQQHKLHNIFDYVPKTNT
jgi:hypothetical protein